jgi:hypothetical protein
MNGILTDWSHGCAVTGICSFQVQSDLVGFDVSNLHQDSGKNKLLPITDMDSLKIKRHFDGIRIRPKAN